MPDSLKTRGAGAANPRAGFTLVELMAVIAILAILMAVLIPRIGSMGEAARSKLTVTQLRLIAAAIDEYEDEHGDYPPSQFKADWGVAPNATNLGAECVVLSLWSDDWGGTSLTMEELVNSDIDGSKKEIAELLGKELFELRDKWDNPIAYFHRRDYGRADPYVSEDPDTGESIESSAKSVKDTRTGKWAQPRRFQLISPGPDGRFGSEDDLYNFKVE